MAVIRVNKTKDYTIMSNYHLRDKNLSLKAKGLLSLVLSLPSNWNYSVEGLVKICIESETSVKSALNELKKYGYLIVEKEKPNKSNGGRINYIYNFYEKAKIQEGGFLPLENLDLEIQPLEILDLENVGQLNTKELNKDYQLTKEEKKEGIYSRADLTGIIDYLNLKTNKHFKYTDNNLNKIKARLNEGFSLEDFKVVIDKKTFEWLRDSKFNQFLRPETLFGSKFESYLNQEVKKKTLSDISFEELKEMENEENDVCTSIEEDFNSLF